MKAREAVKPHLLYVAFAYPPSTASSVYRSLAVPNAFAGAGWDVTVLTIDGQTWSEISGLDTDLLQSVDPSVRVVRVSDGGSEEPAKGDLRAFSRLRVEAPYVWERILSLRSTALFPEKFHGLWRKPASAAAREIHRRHTVDLVIGSASPYVSFAVASSLPGVPYVMDYRDAWAFNTINGRENFTVESRTGKLESTLLEGALQVWFVNEPIQEEYARRYSGSASKMRVVPNGFDPQPGHARPVVKPVTKPSFGYLGTLQHENNPFDELLEGWVDAFGVSNDNDVPTAVAHIRGKLSSSGSSSPELLRKLEDVRRHGLEYDGPVPKRQVAAFYRSLDALILLLASGKYVTGGKTAEYLATGLPIVSVHEQGNATTEMLRDYPLWFPAEELTAPAVSAALSECAEALKEPDAKRWAAAWDYGQSFLRTTLIAPVIEELTRSVNGPYEQAASRADSEIPNPTVEPIEARPVSSQVDEDGSGNPSRSRQTTVVVVMGHGNQEVLQDLRSRTSSVTGVAVSLIPFVVDGTEQTDGAHPVRLLREGSAERCADWLAEAGSLVGVFGRLLRDNLRSRRLARSVLKDELFREQLVQADVVMATGADVTRAVWQLRSRTQAELVRGAVALDHVLKNR